MHPRPLHDVSYLLAVHLRHASVHGGRARPRDLGLDGAHAHGLHERGLRACAPPDARGGFGQPGKAAFRGDSRNARAKRDGARHVTIDNIAD